MESVRWKEDVGVEKTKVLRAQLKGAFDNLVPCVIYPLATHHHLRTLKVHGEGKTLQTLPESEPRLVDRCSVTVDVQWEPENDS
jgi:hypothetical protein